MVVKNQQKIQVVREYTEADIKGLGSTFLLRKKTKKWVAILGVAVLMTIVLSRLFNPSLITVIIDILPVVIAFGFFYIQSRKVGQQIWDYIKDKPQPVKLDF